MAELSAERRKNIPKSEKGLPSRHKEAGKQGQSGDYPMPDKAHARNAKARAAQQLKKGNLSSSQKAQIDRKANKILGKSGK
jgi:hypothetical protein